ncbi:lipopolysaccharide biosynthesis protein [Pedobacter sp. MW01-1-1]|uniref:lipopolysaccharide biosynthesis protein n=1 Tax=Pedobacter sp. MW01-1-1 TaxID=3383027 RepID=UPI003FEE7460
MAGVDLGSGGGGIFQGDNILELYKSRKMIEQTLLTEVDYEGKKQLLIDRYIAFNTLKDKWKEKPELLTINFSERLPLKSQILNLKSERLRDSVLGTIVADINKNYLTVAKPDKKLSIIKAEVKASDEFFAKAFDEQIVKNVNDFYVQTKTKKSVENVQILQQKTDSVRAVMNGAIYTAAAVADATPNLNPTRQVQRIAPAQRSQFSAETNKAILSSLVQNLEMAKISMRKDAPLIQIVDEPVYPLRKDVFSKIKGIILGGIILGFLSVIYLIFKIILKNILSE